MILVFTLSMPNVGSWNGKWTSADQLHAKVVNIGTSKKAKVKGQKIIDESPFYYNFGDGWGAGINVKEVDAKEAAKIRRKSNGFCSYDWMVDSIRTDLEIIAPSSRNT